jgi:hypothetical protein
LRKKSREQAQIRQDIVTGRKQDPERKDIWIPTIPEFYIQFKEEYYYPGKIDPMTTTTSKNKKRAKNAGATEDATIDKRITRSKAARRYSTTSPVTIENLADLDFRAGCEQAPNKFPTTFVLFSVGIVENPQ